MSSDEQSVALMKELHNVINRFRCEFEVSYLGVIGALEIVKLSIHEEMRELEDEE